MSERLRRPLLVWFALVLVGSSWALSTGRYGGPDEPAHTVRAAAVARGELVGQPVTDLEAGYRSVQVPRSIASGDPACYRHDPSRDASCAVASDSTASTAAATSAGTFPPIYYAAVGLIARLVGSGDTAIGHRLAAVVLVSLALAVAHLRLTRWPDRGRAALFWATITPAAWYLTGVVNTNSLEVALIAVAWVLTAELLGAAPVRDPQRHVLALGVVSAVVVAIRPIGVTGVLAIVATLVAGLAGSQRLEWRGAAVRRACGLVLCAAALVGAWWLAVGLRAHDTRTAVDVTIGEAVRRAATGAVDTTVEAVASLGWAEFWAPWPAVLGWVAVATTCIWALVHSDDRRLWRAAAAWVLVLVIGPMAFEIVTATRIGFVWQGRYSTGALLGIGALGAAALGRTRQRLALVVCALAPVTSTLTLWASTRRYVSGTDGSWWFEGDGWSPPLGPWLPLAVQAAATTLLVVLLLRPNDADRRAATVDRALTSR